MTRLAEPGVIPPLGTTAAAAPMDIRRNAMRDFIILSRWAPLTRVYVACIVSIVGGAICTVAFLDAGIPLSNLWLVAAGGAALALLAVLISPETWVTRQGLAIVRGIAIGPARLRVFRGRITTDGDPIIIERFNTTATHPHKRGWYVGVRLVNGRTIWFGFARHRRHAEVRANEVRAAVLAWRDDGVHQPPEAR